MYRQIKNQMLITCKGEGCNAQFLQDHPNRRLCKNCKKQSNRSKTGRHRKPNCDICNKPFGDNTHYQRYCSDRCADIGIRIYRRERRIKQLQKEVEDLRNVGLC